MRIAVCLMFVLAMCGVSSAQDGASVWGRRNFSYATYNVGNQTVYASYHRVGRFEYGQFSNGAISTSNRVGSRVYTTLTLPARALGCKSGNCR